MNNSYRKNASNSKFNGQKKYRVRKGPKKDLKKDRKETKGFWEYNDYQKIEKPNDEEKIKKSLTFIGGFNPKKVDQYLNPIPSKEEVILQKIEEGKKLNSSEKIIIDNYNFRIQREINKDMENIKKFNLNAEVTTDEGKRRKLLNTLEHVIKKKDSNMIALIHQKLKDPKFAPTVQLQEEYSDLLNRLKTEVSKLDLVKLQMTTLHSSQPPLDQKGFTKLDDFQVQVINNIDNRVSSIVSAPTSSGKSVISGYSFTKGNTLVIVPTDVLAWQMASYMGEILNTNIPIITETFQSIPRRDELVELVNKSNSLVGTADAILNFLPFIKIKFDWIVFDEVHMIGKSEGSSMEHIARLYPDVPFLGLSATIGNVEELKNWFESVNNTSIDIVKCDKRFFNLQRYIYFNESDKMERVHPLGMLTISDLEDGSILSKSIQPTPPDIWDFATKLDKILKLGDLKPYTYFSQDDRITLDMSNEYFNRLLRYMIENYKGKNIQKINNLIEDYQHIDVKSEDIDLMKLIFHLKKIKKCPAIIFQENSTSCMRLVRQFAKQLEDAQNEKYPDLMSERSKEAKKAKKVEKENEKKKIDDIGENKRIKMMLQDNAPEIEAPIVTPMQQPHTDFIVNDEQLFTGAVVEGWVNDLKKYFPNTGDDYHWLIVMLWRGVGVYVKGLPDPYLRLVQSLASSKKLAVVFSDSSLVFGVSMPFRTTVILRDMLTEDKLDSMMYHQMAGRAGRRGLDKEGNVVFAGYSWDRIKNLSISSFPVINGSDTMVYSISIAKMISNRLGINAPWNNLKTNFLHSGINNDTAKEFYDDIDENIGEDGGWDFLNTDCTNHNYMVWRLRHDIDCVTVPMIIPELVRAFSNSDPNSEKDQVEIALFLSHFINLKESSNPKFVLPDSEYFKHGNASKLKSYADNLGIEIPEHIDSMVYQSIVLNKLLRLRTEKDIDDLRTTLIKFSTKVRHIQHYFFHSKQVTMARLLGKLLTRLWWIYHTSSPLMKSWRTFDTNVYDDTLSEEDESVHFGSDSEEEESDDEEYEEDSEEEGEDV